MNQEVRRDSLLRALDTVLRTTLRTSIDAEGVMRSTNDVVANAGKVPDPATTNEDDRVFLEVVTFTTDVGTDLTTVGEAHTCNLPQGGVWLLRGLGSHLKADATPLGTGIEVTNLGLGVRLPARLANELIDRRHEVSVGPTVWVVASRKG